MRSSRHFSAMKGVTIGNNDSSSMRLSIMLGAAATRAGVGVGAGTMCASANIVSEANGGARSGFPNAIGSLGDITICGVDTVAAFMGGTATDVAETSRCIGSRTTPSATTPR